MTSSAPKELVYLPGVGKKMSSVKVLYWLADMCASPLRMGIDQTSSFPDL